MSVLTCESILNTMEKPILIGDELSDDSASNISNEYYIPNYSDDYNNDNNTKYKNMLV